MKSKYCLGLLLVLVTACSAPPPRLIVESAYTGANGEQNPGPVAQNPGTPSGPANNGGGVPANLDGAALFAASCQGCHTAEAMKGKKAAGILNAITNVAAMKGLSAKFPQVTPELQAIETFLNPLDGAALFAATCQGCHTAEAMQGKKAAGILTAIANVAAMKGLSAKFPEATPELQAIETFLNTAPNAELDGAALFAANCQGCHPKDAVDGDSTEDILEAIATIPAMAGLKAKYPAANEELSKIADFLDD